MTGTALALPNAPHFLTGPVGSLEAYVERDASAAQIVAQGFEAAVVRRVIRLINLAEYKRRQAAPGIRITPRNFGKDRRYPITCRYRPGETH